MRLIFPDPARRIDLPGVGPCPRPTDIDQGVTGFQVLKSLRIYRFQPGAAIEGESEVDEVLLMPLTGRFRIAISGAHPAEAELAPDGAARALYMTPEHAYRLTPLEPTLVAYARAEAAGRVPVTVLGEDASALGEHLRHEARHLAEGEALETPQAAERLVHVVAGALDAEGEAVAAGETLALAPGEAPALTATRAAQVLVVSA